MPEMINVEEARAYALEHFPSPVVRRPIEALLDDCPRTAEAVRHGKWVDNTKLIQGAPDYLFNCSECGFAIWGSMVVGLNYCSCCGAKMDAKEDEHERDL